MQITKKITNAALIPPIKPDSDVLLDENGTPDWADGLIFAQVRIISATKEGTLKSAVSVLDHYTEMGVNALWICPVYEPGVGGNGYSNLGPHTVDPAITGTTDYEKGWLAVKDFVDEAHSRNIRILLDLISWGTVKGAPLKEEHPDWYTGLDEWGGDAFDWKNEEFKEWYIQTAVNIVVTTGCDGFRYDVEPRYAGYAVDKEIRDRLHKLGRKPFMMAESGNERRGAYDCEQIGVTNSIPGYFEEEPVYYFINRSDLVDSIKLGVNIGSGLWKNKNCGCEHRYYVNTVTCHDHRYPVVKGNRLAIGYQAIFAPFIPQWYIGEEWNNPRNIIEGNGGSVLYFNEINWEAKNIPENNEFFEDVKKMIRIRRSYPEIFSAFPPHFKDSNICKVSATGGGLQAYARYADSTALLILPNVFKEAKELKVTIPFDEMKLNTNAKYLVKDAATGETLMSGTAAEISEFTVTVSPVDQRIIELREIK